MYVRLKGKIVHHLCVLAASFCVCYAFHAHGHCAFPPFTPAFNIASVFFVGCCSPLGLAALPHAANCECMLFSVNIESGGIRGRGRVVHYFVRQPLASEAFF